MIRNTYNQLHVRYNSAINKYEIGYWRGTTFVIVSTTPVENHVNEDA